MRFILNINSLNKPTNKLNKCIIQAKKFVNNDAKKCNIPEKKFIIVFIGFNASNFTFF